MSNISKEQKINVLKRSIIISWTILFLCLFIKFFGGNYFEIVVTNKNFISVCNFIDNHIILKFAVRYISYLFVMMTISASLIQTKVSKKEKIKWALVLITINSLRLINVDLGAILDILYFIILSYIYDKKKFAGIVAPLLMTVFQIISLVTRNIGIHIVVTNSLTEIILSVDYYIMIILYYLHSEVRR